MKGPLIDLECAAEHAAARQEPAPGAYAPGGRWERILRALHRRGPLKASEVYAATRGADHSSRIERAKVWRALVGLEDLGFVQADQGRFAITSRGDHALRDGDAV
ncbi:hypothetical protein [Brevundimonas sp. SPF441]|uniref:hypothetical protein n=1 Tax=Brevundimonas sp. SPF441 TaxID=2663795 RepID=UPI00129E9EB1|nr:hypothetical protein [Brevundimonas sp. SPF441]MRL69792.1 hypothetical protein [Brevundimonas sp. SPF441]